MTGSRWLVLMFVFALTGCGWKTSGSSTLAASDEFKLAERTLVGNPALKVIGVFLSSGVWGEANGSGQSWDIEKLQCFRNGGESAEEINCRVESSGRKIALAQQDSSMMYHVLATNDGVSTSAAGGSVGTAYEVSCLDLADPQADAVCHFKVVVKT